MKTEVLEHPKLTSWHTNVWVSDRTKFNIWPGLKATFVIDENELILITRKGVEQAIYVINLKDPAQDYPVVSCFRVIPVAVGRDESGRIEKAFLAFQRVTESAKRDALH